MGLKEMVKAGAERIRRLPILSYILSRRPVRFWLQRLPGAHLLFGRGWDLLHPFDSFYGTDTSGYVPSDELPNSPLSSTKLHVYGGSQPSIIREALKQLPTLAHFTFVDLGCGKGRPMVVASEFGFKEVIGVELSPELADTAGRNIALVQGKFRDRSPMRVEVGDAAGFRFPEGNLVVFLYNPFGREVVERVVHNLEAALDDGAREIFVIYYNPVQGAVVDATAKFSRYFARTIPYAEDEQGFGPDEADPVVIWQAGAALAPKDGAGASIEVTKPNYRAELVSV
jgi:SAM-dependent methyltransferase